MNGRGFGLPGDNLTRNNRLAQMLMRGQTANNGTTAGGIGEVIRQGLAGYLMGKDARDQTAAMQALQQGMTAQPWVDPGTMDPTGMVTGAGQTRGTAGGIEGALAAVSGLGGNEYAGRLTQQLLMQKVARDQQLADLAAQRQFQTQQGETQFERQKELANIKGQMSVQQALDKMMAEDRLAWSRDAAKPYLERGMPVPPEIMGGAAPMGVPEAGGITSAPMTGQPGANVSRGTLPPPPRTLAEARAQEAGMIEAAKVRAKSEAEQNTSTALETFNVGMENLERAMSATTTNPLVGMLPAVTPEAQTAEGAVASLAPVLKQMFRQAGEGIFTDKDQELLLRMVPTRSDFPEARDAKIRMIKEIVNAKLGAPQGVPQAAPGVPPPPPGFVVQ